LYLHEKGIIHKDLKPENVMIVRGENIIVKLIDLGFSGLEEESAKEDYIYGSPGYFAPELFSEI
jgi:serine/threonine-protein kinase Chk2